MAGSVRRPANLGEYSVIIQFVVRWPVRIFILDHYHFIIVIIIIIIIIIIMYKNKATSKTLTYKLPFWPWKRNQSHQGYITKLVGLTKCYNCSLVNIRSLVQGFECRQATFGKNCDMLIPTLILKTRSRPLKPDELASKKMGCGSPNKQFFGRPM